MNTKALASELDPQKLALEAAPLVVWEIGAVDNVDDVAEYMCRGGPWPPQNSIKRLSEETDKRPEKKYWDYVKSEMVLFLCEEDERYAKLWKQLETAREKGTTYVVAGIAAYLGDQIGVKGTMLAGFVAVILYGLVKLNKEALCRYLREENA